MQLNQQNKLIQIHNNKYKENKEQTLKEVLEHQFVIDNKLEGEFLKKCFVYEELFHIPAYNLNCHRVGYISYDIDGCSMYNFDTEEGACCIISERNLIKKGVYNIVDVDKNTLLFFAPDFLTGQSFYQTQKQRNEEKGLNILVIVYNNQDYLDKFVHYFTTIINLEHMFIFNNTHYFNQMQFYENSFMLKEKSYFVYPPSEFKYWKDVLISGTKPQPVGSKEIILDNEKKTEFEQLISQLPKEVAEDLSKISDLNNSGMNKLNNPISNLEIQKEILTVEIPQEKKNSNFFEECLDDLSKEYINIPKKHLAGLLRNIVGNTFQRIVKFNERTPITEQSIFVLSSGEGKTSLADSLTSKITDYYNDYQYEIFKVEYSNYIATKEYLENQLKENKNDLEELKKIQLAITNNEDKKPYQQTLMQTMNTSVFNIPEEVLKGARQNWLFSDEAGATMNSLAWKGDNGNTLIQYLCGAWSDTCKLSNFKVDMKNKAVNRASKTEIRNCSQGMLAMTQHGFFDKLEKDMWIDGGWLARLNLYICDRKPLTIKNRENIFKIGDKFQDNLINLLQKILSEEKDFITPIITEEAKELFDNAEHQAILDANAKKDEAFDPIFNRVKEKAQRTATIYALIEYLTTNEFVITKEIAEKAIQDTWYNIKQSIDFIIQSRSDTFESNPKEIEDCILRAYKNAKKGQFLTIKDICAAASTKLRQNTLLKHKEFIFDYFENCGTFKEKKVVRLEDENEVYWFDIIKSGVVRINYKLRYREPITYLRKLHE